jgi:recombinational DNA repair protein RecR
VAAIVVGDDEKAIAELVADLSARGVRAAVFVGDPATEGDALAEMIAELFARRDI